MDNSFVWADVPAVKNSSFIFSLDIETPCDLKTEVKISAYNYYKFYLNGELKFFGPARSPKGYFRIDKRSIALKKGANRLSVVCAAYNAATYSYVSDEPFFYFTANCGEKTYTADDFKCYDFSEKIKNAQRYSFQRGFCEIYRQNADLKYILKYIEKSRKPIKTKAVAPRKELKRVVPYFGVKRIYETRPIQSGAVCFDKTIPLFRHTCIDGVGHKFDGYTREELYECLTDKICRMSCKSGRIKTRLNENEYCVYDFKGNKTGFIGIDLEVVEDCEIYAIFDELKGEDGCPVSFSRLSCCSVVKWELNKGNYRLETVEPYTLRYCQIVSVKGSAKIKKAFLNLYENTDAYITLKRLYLRLTLCRLRSYLYSDKAR